MSQILRIAASKFAVHMKANTDPADRCSISNDRGANAIAPTPGFSSSARKK
jgi:hypothetical protein